MERPELNYTVKIGDTEKVVKWTYGVSTDIQRFIPSAEDIIQGALTQPVLRDFLIRRLLTDKKGSIVDETQLISVDDLEDFDPEEIIKLVDWGTAHLLYFFTQSMELMKKRSGEFQTQMALLNPPSTGSQTSASKTA